MSQDEAPSHVREIMARIREKWRAAEGWGQVVEAIVVAKEDYDELRAAAGGEGPTLTLERKGQSVLVICVDPHDCVIVAHDAPGMFIGVGMNMDYVQ